MKRILILFICFWNFSSVAATLNNNCSPALPTDHPNFCASFTSSAECYCSNSGLPKRLCQDTHALYNHLMAVFGSLQKACEFQHETPTQLCIDDWNCYLMGGRDSQGKLCSSSGRAC